jgi:hypothetical protein
MSRKKNFIYSIYFLSRNKKKKTEVLKIKKKIYSLIFSILRIYFKYLSLYPFYHNTLTRYNARSSESKNPLSVMLKS